MLFFDFDGVVCFIDYRGGIYNSKTLKQLHLVDINEVSKVRLINGVLYMFDWSKAKAIICFDLETHKQELIVLDAILLGNDICSYDDHFYILDKQQGHVFKYDSRFNLADHMLGFGKGIGRLYDPISIRVVGNGFQVLNWVTSKIVTMDVF